MSARTSIALYPPCQLLPSRRVVLCDKLRLLLLTLMRLVASGDSLPSSIRLARADELFDDGATRGLPKEWFSDAVPSLCQNLRKEVGKISM